MAIKLYDGARSPNARKVRLLAAELEIPIECVRLDFAKGEYRAPTYLEKNPNGKVPTLDDDGFVLWESLAILRYLASKRPERGLAGGDPKQAAIIDQWLFWWTSHPEAALYKLAVEHLIKPFLGQPGKNPDIIGSAEADLARFLPVLDSQLEGHEFVVGGLSLVDFAIGPWLEATDRVGVNLSGYGNITAWLGRLQAKPYWKGT
jgi:glutathione S-transferase